jgi:RNA polymerase sigma factor (sigma-70 family)
MEHEIFTTMDQYAPLPHSELVELHKKGEVELIVLHNLRFAYTQAKKAAERYPGLSQEEIIEGMLIGATEAANRWKPEESKITSYMAQWVPLYIKGMSNENKHAVGRNTMYIWKAHKINEFVEKFKEEHKRLPTTEEIAEQCDAGNGKRFSKTTVYNIYNLGIKSVSSISGSQVDSDEGERDLNDVIADDDAKSPLDMLCESDISMIIERLIDGLDPLEKEVINRRWYERHKYNQIATDLDVAYPKIKQAEERAMAKLKRELELIETT